MSTGTTTATPKSPYRRKARRPGSTSKSAGTQEIRRSARNERDVSIALLYNAGIPASRLAAISGLSDAWIRHIVNRYNAQFEPVSKEPINEPTTGGERIPA